MSFKATLSDPEKHQIWSRAVNALSTIYEDIRLTIAPTELIVWNINSTDTTLSKVRFSARFFDEYTFQPREIIFGESGVQVVTDSHGVDHRLYSLQINGKHLSTISKRPDGDTIKNFSIAINNSPTCPDILTNRLLVHVEMESLIRKEYTPQFQPIEYDPIIIDLKYKRNFLNVYGSAGSVPPGEVEQPLDPKLQNIFTDARRELSEALFNDDTKTESTKESKLTVADEINYICCKQAILKNFIDNCNSSVTEEFKLDINTHKLVMTAFTKAIYGKNNDILRNTMRLSNTISVADLEHYCLFTTAEESEDNVTNRKDQTKSIVFKLKDLKNFLSTGWTWKNAQSDDLNIWFCHSGDPVLIELKRNDLTLQLVQVTDSNNTNIDRDDQMAGTVIKKAVSPEKLKVYAAQDDAMDFRRSPLKTQQTKSIEPRISPLKDKPSSRAVRPPKQLFVTDSQPTPRRKGSIGSGIEWTDDDQASRQPTQLTEEPTNTAPVRAERTGTTIEWGKRPREVEEDFSTLDRQSLLKKEKLKLFEAINNSQELDGLGPTQQTRPKGLLD